MPEITHCPACGEPAYNDKKCMICGQRYATYSEPKEPKEEKDQSKLKECPKCHKVRSISNQGLGWCRGCLKKQHEKFHRTKILPHPEKYNPILERISLGFNQKQIAKDLVMSRQTVQRVVSRYTVLIDSQGREWRR